MLTVDERLNKIAHMPPQGKLRSIVVTKKCASVNITTWVDVTENMLADLNSSGNFLNSCDDVQTVILDNLEGEALAN